MSGGNELRLIVKCNQLLMETQVNFLILRSKFEIVFKNNRRTSKGSGVKMLLHKKQNVCVETFAARAISPFTCRTLTPHSPASKPPLPIFAQEKWSSSPTMRIA